MQNNKTERVILQKRNRKGEIFHILSISGLDSEMKCKCNPIQVKSPSARLNKLSKINNIFIQSAPSISITKMETFY